MGEKVHFNQQKDQFQTYNWQLHLAARCTKILSPTWKNL